jgi:sugar phosphate isomerase/epimerase
VGEKIVTLHVSDYDGIDERHWLPGEGCIDWQALRAALCEVGYDGVWMYELSFGIPKSLPRGRDLCCADFVKNAAELAENAPLTRVK